MIHLSPCIRAGAGDAGETFARLDTDHSGSVSLEEALPLLIIQAHKVESIVRGASARRGVFDAAVAIFQTLDVNKDGKISREARDSNL
jgi:hypothetical protein